MELELNECERVARDYLDIRRKYGHKAAEAWRLDHNRQMRKRFVDLGPNIPSFDAIDEYQTKLEHDELYEGGKHAAIRR